MATKKEKLSLKAKLKKAAPAIAAGVAGAAALGTAAKMGDGDIGKGFSKMGDEIEKKADETKEYFANMAKKAREFVDSKQMSPSTEGGTTKTK